MGVKAFTFFAAGRIMEKNIQAAAMAAAVEVLACISSL